MINRSPPLTPVTNTLQQAVAEAEVSDLAWGLLGKATVYGSYAELLAAFQKHLDEIPEGLTGGR